MTIRLMQGRARLGRRLRAILGGLACRDLVFDLIEQRYQFVSQAFPFRPIGPAKIGLRLIPVVMWVRSRHIAFRQAPDGTSTVPFLTMESPILTFVFLW